MSLSTPRPCPWTQTWTGTHEHGHLLSAIVGGELQQHDLPVSTSTSMSKSVSMSMVLISNKVISISTFLIFYDINILNNINSLCFLFDVLSHSAFFPIRCFFHSTFCPIRCFFHLTFCPIQPFVFRRFVIQHFLLSAFVTSTFCWWT